MTTPSLYLTLTGQSRIAAAIASGTTVQITHIAIGDGGGPDPVANANRVTLFNEVWRDTVQSVVTDANDPTLRGLTYRVPAASGGYIWREVGAFASNGDLIIHGIHEDIGKPAAGLPSAIEVDGTLWLNVADADTLEIVVSLTDGVPQSRVLTAGHGLQGGGNLGADRRFDLAFGELALDDTFPATTSFPVHRSDGQTIEAQHERISLGALDKRWRQRRGDLLFYGQF